MGRQSTFHPKGDAMTKDVKHIASETKDSLVGAIRGVGDIAAAVVDTVSGVIVRGLKGTRLVGSESVALTVEAVTGAVHGVAEVGTEVGTAAQSIMVGALRGTQKVGQVTLETVSSSAEALVKTTSEVGG